MIKSFKIEHKFKMNVQSPIINKVKIKICFKKRDKS